MAFYTQNRVDFSALGAWQSSRNWGRARADFHDLLHQNPPPLLSRLLEAPAEFWVTLLRQRPYPASPNLTLGATESAESKTSPVLEIGTKLSITNLSLEGGGEKRKVPSLSSPCKRGRNWARFFLLFSLLENFALHSRLFFKAKWQASFLFCLLDFFLSFLGAWRLK